MYSIEESGILNIADKEYDIFLNKANVIGLGLGNKIINNITTDERVATVFVTKKVNKSLLDNYNLIPREYKGFKTDVVEMDFTSSSASHNDISAYATAPTNYIDRVRPFEFGYAIENIYSGIPFGSGCLVYDSKGYYILGTNERLANTNTGPIGSEILQPPTRFGGIYPQDVIARLSRFIPVKSASGIPSGAPMPENYTDAAIAKLLVKPNFIKKSIVNLGIPTGIADPTLNMTVRLSVPFDGTITTTIINIGITQILYYAPPVGPALHKNLFRTAYQSNDFSFSSATLDTKNRVVGYFFAQGGLHCLIKPALTGLGVKLVTT